MHRLFLFYPQQVAHDSIWDEDAFGGEFQGVFLDFQYALPDVGFGHLQAIIVQGFSVGST